MAVGGELDRAVAKAGSEIEQEGDGVIGIASANEPGHDQLGVGIESDPRPYVAPAELSDVLFWDSGSGDRKMPS